MSHILHIASSPTLDGQSRSAAAHVITALAPITLTTRDLAQSPLPHIDDAWNKARIIAQADRTPHDIATLALSDTLIDELRAADTLIISMPMYNFGMPASLKAWIDLICRPKITFTYTSGAGVRGLITDKRAIIVVASGGVPIDDPTDFATPHLRQVLSFIGITDIETIVAKDILAANS